jgi:rSAM/selenodomain-associated transferase 2
MIKAFFSRWGLLTPTPTLTRTPEFSVIIPCYHDETALDHLLDQLQKLPHRPLEIIVVDGANSKLCQKTCSKYPVQWLACEPNRGQQLLAGADLAQGDILWFLHADARLPSDPLMAMTQALNQGAIGGYFRFRFDAPRAWPALILEPAIALRCHFGTPYGDQGLFISKQIYTKVGGHAPWPLFEEVPLVRGARQAGNFIALSESILVNPRRWQRDGWWQRTWRNRQLALNFALGTTPNRLASQYHSSSQSKKT